MNIQVCFSVVMIAFSSHCFSSTTQSNWPEYNRHETQSFFEPGKGTKNIVYGANSLPLIFTGQQLPVDILVASDIGANLSRYSKSGELAWRVNTYPNTVRAIEVYKGEVIAYAGKFQYFINSDSGAVREKNETGRNLLFSRHSGNYLIQGEATSGVGAVLVNGQPLREETKWARDAIVHDDKIYVADTFGHRVIEIDGKTLETLSQKSFYYPNDLLIIDGKLAIVEEHSNRVIFFDSGEVHFSCPIWAYVQNTIPVQSIEKTIAKYNSRTGIGRCAREFMGVNTLYSPNGAAQVEDTTIIADTDNHRIVAVRGGEVVSELLGVNNPVRIIPLTQK